MPKSKKKKTPAPVPVGPAPQAAQLDLTRAMNLAACGCHGCHVADETSEWIIGALKLSDEEHQEFLEHQGEDDDSDDGDDDPQVKVEILQETQSTGVFSVCNFSDTKRCAYVSAMSELSLVFLANKGSKLGVGETTPPEAEDATARVRLSDDYDLSKMSFPYEQHPDKEGTLQTVIPNFAHFPLGGSGPFLCTQGFGGRLTHFFPESYHAVDFRCPVGTPVLAVADGEITELLQECSVTGMHCLNLAQWNSVALAIDGGFTVEYLHIQPASARVKVGDKVRAGDVICLSGKVGFAPEPHLHLEVHLTASLRGPSVRFHLRHDDGVTTYVPIAGESYTPAGPIHG